MHVILALVLCSCRMATLVCFSSKKFIPAEANYSTSEENCWPVVYALQEWRCYLEGLHFTVVTDHNPLTFFLISKPLSPAAGWLV
jgi:hypothetical protein